MIRRMWNSLGLAGRVVAACGVLLALVAMWWVFIGGPAHDRRKAAEARAAAIVSDRDAGAARDAVGVVTGQNAAEAATDKITQENRDAILQAPGAGVPIDPELDAATRRALCLRDAYRDQPACVRLLGPRPR